MASLHLLIDNDDLDVLKMKELLEKDAWSINNKNEFGETPLERVIKSENCSTGIVEMFLDYGANPHISDMFGNSAFMYAINNSRNNILLRVLLQRRSGILHDTDLQMLYTRYLSNHLQCCDRSVDIVKIFLRNGANVNHFDNYGSTNLINVLQFCSDKEIIRELLAAHADPNRHDMHGRYPLCIALRYDHSVDVIKMLLNARSSLNGCMKHGSVLHCATDCPHSGLKEDVLNLLLKEGADVRRVDKRGQSLLCFAIPKAKEASDIKLLLKAGASLTACSKHSSPLLCATVHVETRLSEETVKLLVGEGARVDVVNDKGLSPLELALNHCCYETEAIKLLFNLQIAVTKCRRWNESILHFALSNSFCKVSALEFLINNGAQLDTVNSSGDSLMHVAVSAESKRNSELSIIRFLLKRGTPVNEENASRKTPLELAAENECDVSILQMLLAAGARVNRTLILSLLDKYDDPYWRFQYLYLLLKYAYLQNPDISDFIQRRTNSESLLDFCAKCLNEVQKMKSKIIGDSHSLREFLYEFYFPREIEDDNNIEINFGYFNQLLKLLKTDEFPLFLDVIVTKIGREMMKIKMQELKVYAVKYVGNVQVLLNYDSVCNIARFLSDDDLFRLILAFYSTDENYN